MRAKLLRRLVVLAAAWLAAAVPTARAATDIQLWHAMPGELGYQLDKLASDFNASQRDYRVVPVFKGLYSETMLAALFAMRLREHPAIVQVAEVATATMMAAKS
ncbi:MAG: sn-glycerol 3-phosphate transport system substrate-binding protein, partial [Alphaproteobacteria bacterium]|nr:sn-glycerol 3-phosphate transport system substrate-binding protein [Alphaproteobacteria bacterium]